MQTLELKKIYKPLFSASAKAPQLVDVPHLNFLRIDGAIEPGHAPGNSPIFSENLQALYSASYTLKFMLKQRPENPVDYPVMPLEGLWWVEDGRFDININDNWHYSVQIMQPDCVTPELFAEALAKLRKKKGNIEAFSRLRLELFHEGLALQMLHIGPYAAEPATVEKNGCLPPGRGTAKARRPPRNLPRRPDARRPCQTQDHIETPGNKMSQKSKVESL